MKSLETFFYFFICLEKKVKAPREKLAKPKLKCGKLHWEAVPKNQVNGRIWENLECN